MSSLQRPKEVQASSLDASFALTNEQGRIEARAAFIAMANMNSAADRWTDPGDIPGKIAVFAVGGMIGQRDWDQLASALAGLFDAFTRSSPRVASFIEREARIHAILASQFGTPFGAAQESGSRAFQSKIPVFYGAFRDEFIWTCRHTLVVEPGQERIGAAAIEQGVTADAVSEWFRSFVLFDRAIIEANQ